VQIPHEPLLDEQRACEWSSASARLRRSFRIPNDLVHRSLWKMLIEDLFESRGLGNGSRL